MRKLLVIALGAVTLVVGAFLIYVSLQPNAFEVERTITINAPAEQVFPRINNLHNWSDWSPWRHLDPQMKETYVGSESGKGAIYRWSGNEEAGAGQMTITDSEPFQRVVILLEFTRPYESVCLVTFTLKPQDDQTTVSWLMTGETNFLMKAMFLDMDAMVGPDFEKGLASLKANVEAETNAAIVPADAGADRGTPAD
ncbi:SRPBCC family protein [Lignipirellula cremea]|uniref:Polyketide cyclase / dehydrase and lipid transport n=1 Tax=Lignipirellula cremea TaxID=2528010 RepID=A0A518DS28_9BACT|nr:SRPBCC family protein [Lignipirellula cremea]QDU94645.1 Polyketide cyclase / dehydrase and lipid transport [Lignipirellula cremea]